MAVPLPLHPHSSAEPMVAAVYERFGPPEVIEIRTLARPKPRDHEIRVRIKATTVTSACTMMRRGDTVTARIVLGLFGPRRRFQIAGIEFAGTIDSVGRNVRDWRPGDDVFGFAGFNVGTYADYFCLPASASVAPMPPGISYAEAASLVDGPTTALFFLRDLAQVRPGERVLVIGAAGSVGGAAVQVARYLGAQVTGVCSAANAERVQSLGAHEIIDYTRSDITRMGRTYDVIFDAVTKSSFRAARHCLARGGRYLPTVPRLRDYALMVWTRLAGGRKVVCGMSVEKRSALAVVSEMLAAGVLRPVIDRRYPLAQIAEAHRYVDTGRKRGNVVIDLGEGEDQA